MQGCFFFVFHDEYDSYITTGLSILPLSYFALARIDFSKWYMREYGAVPSAIQMEGLAANIIKQSILNLSGEYESW